MNKNGKLQRKNYNTKIAFGILEEYKKIFLYVLAIIQKLANFNGWRENQPRKKM